MSLIRSLILLALVTQLQALSPHSLSIAEPVLGLGVVGQSQASFNVPQSEISFSVSSSYDGNNGFEDFDFDALRLVRFFSPSSDSEEEEALGDPEWVTERAKLDAKKFGQGYIDITEHPEWGLTAALLHNLQRESLKHVYHPPNSTSVTKIFPLLSSEEQKTNLEIFTSFYTRSYVSYTGYAAAQWLYQRAVNYTEVYASDKLKEAVDIELELQEHSAFKQRSVIIRLSPKNSSSHGSNSSSGDITIIGAHLDSINKEDPFARSPGADDDGSGTITVLEAYRGILQSGYVPTSPLEFHFYAGEEGGLLGSIDISDAYAAAGKSVRGMMEFDMTAWVEAGKPEEIGIIMNLADPALTEFLKLVVDKYIDIPWVETRYPGRAGSDYMSWTLAGYQSCHSVEAAWENMNPNPHQKTDMFNVSSEFSFDHILRFTKLAVAFAVELSDY